MFVKMRRHLDIIGFDEDIGVLRFTENMGSGCVAQTSALSPIGLGGEKCGRSAGQQNRAKCSRFVFEN